MGGGGPHPAPGAEDVRVVHELGAHERTQQALQQSEAMRQIQTKSQGLKQ